MANKVLLCLALAIVLLGVATAGRGGQRGGVMGTRGNTGFNRRNSGMGIYATQSSRLMQAACSVTNVTSGDVLQDSSCNCGDETAACDVGPVSYFDLELYFCNILDDQTEDDLYVMQFACVSGQDMYCGAGTFCDIGPLTYDGVEYYLCRFDATPTTDDTSYMCKPDPNLALFPMWGIGAAQQYGRGARWAAAGGMPVNPAYPVNGGVQPINPAMPANPANPVNGGAQPIYPAMPNNPANPVNGGVPPMMGGGPGVGAQSWQQAGAGPMMQTSRGGNTGRSGRNNNNRRGGFF